MRKFLQGIRAFVVKHRAAIIVLVVSAIVVGVGSAYAWYAQPGRHHDYWNVPTRQPLPLAVREAERVATSIARNEATWKAEIDELTRLVEEQKPGEFDLLQELVTTDAFRHYVEKLLRSGEAAVAEFAKMQQTTIKLHELLQEAPTKYREMASLARGFAADARRHDIKEDYATLADIWEAKARAAEAHQHDVDLNLNSDLFEYLQERNIFLERFLTMLNKGLVTDDLREVASFRKTLQELAYKHEFLRSTLRTWRARLLSEPAVPPPVVEDSILVLPKEVTKDALGPAPAPEEVTKDVDLPKARKQEMRPEDLEKEDTIVTKRKTALRAEPRHEAAAKPVRRTTLTSLIRPTGAVVATEEPRPAPTPAPSAPTVPAATAALRPAQPVVQTTPDSPPPPPRHTFVVEPLPPPPPRPVTAPAQPVRSTAPVTTAPPPWAQHPRFESWNYQRNFR